MKKQVFNILLFLSILGIGACRPFVHVQQRALYDVGSTNSLNEINGFNALQIFQDDYDNSVWVSPEKQCIQLERVSLPLYAGQGALHVKWDKVSGGCTWLGTGFGWNNWLPKDMLDIIREAAVQIHIKSAKGSFYNLPVAFAFEDYQGTQIFAGFEKSMTNASFTDSTWTSVTIPLSKFRFDRSDFNAEQVKQFIIQWEGEGDIYLDDIKLIRWQP